MSELSVWIDGWPFKVEYQGAVNIERAWDGETVVFRGDGIKVMEDAETLERHRETLRKMHAEIQGFKMFWTRSLDPVEQAIKLWKGIDYDGRTPCD